MIIISIPKKPAIPQTAVTITLSTNNNSPISKLNTARHPAATTEIQALAQKIKPLQKP